MILLDKIASGLSACSACREFYLSKSTVPYIWRPENSHQPPSNPSSSTSRYQLDQTAFTHHQLLAAAGRILLSPRESSLFLTNEKRAFSPWPKVNLLISSAKCGLKFSISNIQSGFRKTGIFPLDPFQFPSIKFNPGKLKAYNERE